MVKNTISELALGKFGRLQEANFFVSGGLIVTLGVLLIGRHAALYQSLGVVIMGGIMFLSAFFRTDPVDQSVTRTTTPRGTVHIALFMVGILAMMTAQLGWSLHNFGSLFSLYSLLSGIVVLVCFAGVANRPQQGGLFQRILLVDIMTWITMFALINGR